MKIRAIIGSFSTSVACVARATIAHHSVRFGAVFVAWCFVAGASSAQTLEWTMALPIPRAYTTLAYDSARGVTVMFGGTARTQGLTDDTWEWDGTTWVQPMRAGPYQARFAVTAFDSRRDVVVLVCDSITGASQTWEWNATEWQLIPSSGRPPTGSRAAVYDDGRGVVVLVGRGETWEWDGQTWAQRATTGPSSRLNTAMAYDSGRGVTVLYGGSSRSDTWEWDGASWVEREASGPGTRSLHAMAYDAARHRTVLFGGATSGSWATGDTWSWDGENWTLETTNGPLPRQGPAMAFDSARGRIVLSGGNDHSLGDFGDTWEWDGQAWRQRIAVPLSRKGAAMAYDRAHANSVMFGGNYGVNSLIADTWIWNGDQWTEQSPSSSPSPRFDHRMVYDEDRREALLFGGFQTTTGNPSGETWVWDGGDWSLRSTEGPAPRGLHCLSYDAQRHVAVLFGGASDPSGTTLYGDTWEWDGAGWTLLAMDGPSARSSGAMTYDPVAGVTLLHGGGTGNAMYETWTWNGESWVQRVVSGPGIASPGSVTFDAARGFPLLFFGFGTAMSTLWEWRDDAWVEQDFAGIWWPFPRREHAAIYDPGREETIVFGGRMFYYGTGINGETWRLAPLQCNVPSVYRGPSPASVCRGNTANFTCLLWDLDPVSYRWRKDGVELSDVPGHLEGTQTQQLRILNADFADEGQYDCVASRECGSTTSRAASLTVVDRVGDLNSDNRINMADLTILLTNFGRTDQPTAAEGDIDGDGAVRLSDLALLLGSYGLSCQ